MSVFEELLKKHCPDGVEYKTLSEIGEFSNIGVDKKKVDGEKEILLLNFIDVMKNMYIDKSIPKMVVTASDYKIEKCTIEEGDIFITPSSETIDEIGFASVITETIPNACYSYHIMRFRLFEYNMTTSIFIRYCFDSSFLRKQIRKSAQGITRFGLTLNKWKSLKIPFPPIEVQEEIVRILDEFTEKTNKLQELLHRETILRKKQYEYYRDKLLTFTEGTQSCGDEVEKIQLKDLFYTKNGYTPSKSNPEFWDSKDVSWFRMEDIRENGRILNEAIQKVSFSAIKGNVFPKNSIIVSTSATIGEHALITCESLANQRFTYLILKDEYKNKFNIFFLFYYCYKLKEYCLNCLNQGNFASVDMTKFNKFEFPIISLKEQERIVKILDQFDTLCNDITRGLPAEIELRKKQYEYYRDKLLTFKEKKC